MMLLHTQTGSKSELFCSIDFIFLLDTWPLMLDSNSLYHIVSLVHFVISKAYMLRRGLRNNIILNGINQTLYILKAPQVIVNFDWICCLLSILYERLAILNVLTMHITLPKYFLFFSGSRKSPVKWGWKALRNVGELLKELNN